MYRNIGKKDQRVSNAYDPGTIPTAPEPALLYWKDAFEAGKITEEEYQARRAEILQKL